MKKIFFCCVFAFPANLLFAQTYSIPWAQQQPAWVFPLWFEDGSGAKDTLYFCYDPTADNNGIGHDTLFGEKFFTEDTTSFFLSLSCICPPYDTLALKTIVDIGLPAAEINIWKAKLPLKIKWDRNLFYDSSLLLIPIPNQLPNPLFEAKMWCSDFNPNYNNCGLNYPIFWVPEDNIGCCPDPYGLGIKTDSMIFYGDTIGPLSTMTDAITLNFDIYSQWIGIEQFSHDDRVEVFPNPFNSYINIISSFIPYKLEIFSLLGLKILSKEVTSDNYELKNATFSEGVYILKISNNNSIHFFKLIKK